MKDASKVVEESNVAFHRDQCNEGACKMLRDAFDGLSKTQADLRWALTRGDVVSAVYEIPFGHELMNELYRRLVTEKEWDR